MEKEWDNERIAEDVLRLLFLTSFKDGKDHPWRAWKGHDWDAMNVLHEKGYISNPKKVSKSVILSEEGYQKAKQLAEARYLKK